MKPSSAPLLALTLGLALMLGLSSAQAKASVAERPRWRTLSAGQVGDLKVGLLQERWTGRVAPQLLAGWPAATMRRFNAARAQELRSEVGEDQALIPWACLRPFLKPEIRALFSPQWRQNLESA